MKIRSIVGEVGRFWVESESNPDGEHLVDLLEHECGCASFTCRNREYREKFGHNFTCKHIQAAREAFLNDILESLREYTLSK